jgi:ATP-dependent RNA helicase DeaD
MLTFEELGVSSSCLKAIKELGFEVPMPVQEKVIPILLGEKTDIVVLAQTGTGKTAAFGLPLIQQIDTSLHQPQVLVLCPTRELCVQIAGDLNDFAKYNDDVKILPVYGGASIEMQMKALKKGVQIITATPGRLVDMIERKAVKLSLVHTVVLDEADEMLNMGFSESINDILAAVPRDRNTLLFSATMPNEVASIAKKYMHNPVEITIGNRNSGAENIKHLYFTVHAKDKYLALKRIVDYYPSIYGIVFCRTRKETQEVADKLIHDGYNAESLHGDLSQIQRDTVMNKFRIRHIKLLVATDVAARGLDVEDLTHIINYNLPDDLDSYTHRSGRTGRAGKAGTSIILINLKEKHLIRQIEKKINKTFTPTLVPTGRQICEKQLFNLIDKMENVDIEDKEIDTYLPTIYRKLEWLDKEDIIKRFVALEFNRFLEYYRKSPELNVPDERQHTPRADNDPRNRRKMKSYEDRGDSKYGHSRSARPDDSEDSRHGHSRSAKSEDSSDAGYGHTRPAKSGYKRQDEFRDNHEPEPGFTKLFISLGKSDGMYPRDLIELINKNTPGKMIPLGRIELNKKSTVFEVAEQDSSKVINLLKDATFQDYPFTIDYVKAPGKFDRKPKEDWFDRGARKDRPDRGERKDRPEKRKRKEFGNKDKGKRKSGKNK